MFDRIADDWSNAAFLDVADDIVPESGLLGQLEEHGGLVAADPDLGDVFEVGVWRVRDVVVSEPWKCSPNSGLSEAVSVWASIWTSPIVSWSDPSAKPRNAGNVQ